MERTTSSAVDVCVADLAARRSELAAELAAAEHALKVAMDADSGAKQAAASNLTSHALRTAASADDSSGPLSCLDALVAACELAAEREGLGDRDHDDSVPHPGGAGAPHVHARSGHPADHERDPAAAAGGADDASRTGVVVAKLEPRAAAHHHHASSSAAVRAPAPAAAAGTATAAAAYDAAPKYRRHKSKVYIRPNKVVYLPTTFMEENFEPASLPLNCELIVETNGAVQLERHRVTIKAIPRTSLSTMFCMTNVMKFQQQYLNWQILNWTKVDGGHIQIHLQGPNGGGAKGAPAAPKPEPAVASEVPQISTAAAGAPAGACVASLTGALKRKSSPGCGFDRAATGALPTVLDDDDEGDHDQHQQARARSPLRHAHTYPAAASAAAASAAAAAAARPTRCSGRATNPPSRYARRAPGAAHHPAAGLSPPSAAHLASAFEPASATTVSPSRSSDALPLGASEAGVGHRSSGTSSPSHTTTTGCHGHSHGHGHHRGAAAHLELQKLCVNDAGNGRVGVGGASHDAMAGVEGSGGRPPAVVARRARSGPAPPPLLPPLRSLPNSAFPFSLPMFAPLAAPGDADGGDAEMEDVGASGRAAGDPRALPPAGHASPECFSSRAFAAPPPPLLPPLSGLLASATAAAAAIGPATAASASAEQLALVLRQLASTAPARASAFAPSTTGGAAGVDPALLSPSSLKRHKAGHGDAGSPPATGRTSFDSVATTGVHAVRLAAAGPPGPLPALSM
ncbi:hypothetical protein FOA52_015658 [Chlamydomonas sp. UWO 241]|nr:hypothetical protein FOA52_015658 [Chlamydomonas sp. UWO 241]